MPKVQGKVFFHVIRDLRPWMWIKAGLLVLFGVLNTRMTVGIEWTKANLFYGSLIYGIFTVSIVLENNYFRIVSFDPGVTDEPPYPKWIYFGLAIVTYLTSLILGLIHSLRFNLGVRVLLPLIIFSLLIGGSYYYRKSLRNHLFYRQFVFALTLAFGILYGGILNLKYPPFALFCFFLGIFCLQMGKYLIKAFQKDIFSGENPILLFHYPLIPRNIPNLILIMVSMGAISWVIPLFLPIINKTMYGYGLLVELVVLILTVGFLWKVKHSGRGIKGASITMNIALTILFLLLLLAAF